MENYWWLLIIGMPILIVFVTVILDEGFWQGLRNSWWLDKQKKNKKKSVEKDKGE